MKTKIDRRLVGLVAAGLAGSAATVATAQPYVIKISGATLQQNFFSKPGSTNDYLDCDGNGTAGSLGSTSIQQLAPGLPSNPYPANQFWLVTYRATGSVNGLKELIANGRTYATDGYTGAIKASTADVAIINRTQYINAGASSNATLFNEGNPGADPVRSAMDGTFLASPYLNPHNPMAGGTLIDIAPLDVPVLWGVVGATGTASSSDEPGDVGYGRNPTYGLNKDGTQYLDGSGNPWYHTLAELGTANLNTGSPDSNTIFDTKTAWAPIATLTNFGTDWKQADQSDIRHMLITGRAKNGENLMVITRDAGSGTRNAYNNTVGVDPSWGMGENIQGFNNTSADRLVGPNFQPSNKGGSSGLETTVLNCRLAISYTGAERGVVSGWLSGGRFELLGIRNDLMGGTEYSRPNIDEVLDNSVNGYVFGGPAVFATFGDPRNQNELGGTPGNTHPRMRNSRAAAYVNNITRSVDAFVAVPSDPENFGMPGELLAFQLVLPGATDYVHGVTDPLTLSGNPEFNQTLQDYTRANNALKDSGYYTFGTYSLNGKAPTRTTLTGSNKYSDGNVVGFTTEGGSSVTAGANLSNRNRICGDFNGDADRDMDDITDMIAAWKKRNGSGSWTAPAGTGDIAGAPGTDAIIEVLGDFNMDGNFGKIWDNTNLVYVADTSDVRYFCDGLAKDSGTGSINRAEAFRLVDIAFCGNFFGTTAVTGAAFTNGLAAADVSSATGRHTPGFCPIGQDGVVDASDLNYIAKQFMTLGDRELNWDVIDDAQGRDLSADVNGDLKVNIDDIMKSLDLMGTTKADVNLDGVVDLMDRCAINSNIGNVGGGWLAGDINCDGETNADDIVFAFDAFCPGDFDLNGFVNGLDYDSFASSFESGDACADFDGNGFVNGLDYDAYASYFEGGC
ncbi:MAG: hypothetical protein IT432_07790 [Phycisphaerales bacterium]|nr:hypothetical protein [Phycisphaerales bacterium]